MLKKAIQFLSAGQTIAAELYLPNDTTQKAAAIVLCHGFAGVKELLLPAFAERFAQAGFVALTFDYRGFGASEGEAGRLVPTLQIEDIKNAISFLGTCSQVDPERIGLWGTSFGGANAIVTTAEDQRVKALSVQLTFADGESVITASMSEEEKARFLGTLDKMEEKKRLTGKEMMVPIVKVLGDEQSKAFFNEYSPNYPALSIKIPFLTIAETLKHKPIQAIPKVKAPILIVAATQDSVNPVTESHALFAAANEPKALLELENASHYAVYTGELLERTVTQQIEWFKRYL